MPCRNCGGSCGHSVGFGQLTTEYRDPWDTSQWTITEWAAAAGILASLVWVWNLTTRK